MDVTSLSDVSEPPQDQLDLFEEFLWHNPEVCNNCFTRVRDVEERTIRVGKNREKTREWEHRQRTEAGVQDWSAWDGGRFGRCYCRHCGSDLTARDGTYSMDEIRERARSIRDYVQEHTPLELEYLTFWRVLRSLKTEPDNRGYDTEILAVAFARAVSQ